LFLSLSGVPNPMSITQACHCFGIAVIKHAYEKYVTIEGSMLAYAGLCWRMPIEFVWKITFLIMWKQSLVLKPNSSISQNKQIIFLYNNHCVGFISDINFIYCAERTKSLSAIQVNLLRLPGNLHTTGFNI
jgi:hypothetical protein